MSCSCGHHETPHRIGGKHLSRRTVIATGAAAIATPLLPGLGGVASASDGEGGVQRDFGFLPPQPAGAEHVRPIMFPVLPDPVLGKAAMDPLQRLIRGCPPALELPEAGHFVQEWGDGVARAALRHFQLA